MDAKNMVFQKLFMHTFWDIYYVLLCRNISGGMIYFVINLHVSYDHPLRTLLIAPITEHKHMLNSDGQRGSDMDHL